MVDAHNLDGMVKVGHHILDGGLAVLTQESGIDGDLHDTALRGESPHLVISEVTRMVAEGAAAAMAAHDGLRTEGEGIVETLLSGMAHIDHDAQTVHLAHHLFAETAQAAVGVTAAGGVAEVVVAVMTERHIDDAALGEVLQVLQLTVEGQSVLDAEHDGLTAVAFVFVEVAWSAGDADILTVLLYNLLDLVKDEISIFEGSWNVERHLRGEGLADLRLWQISHHDGSVLTALGHLMEVDEDARITMVELYVLREEHRRVAMGVEG